MGDKKTRIVIAADIFPPDIGGPATHACDVAVEFSRRGHAVQVLCYQDTRFAEAAFPFPVKRIDSRLPLPVKYAYYLCCLWARAMRADVIYAMGPVNAGLPAIIAGFFSRTPVAVKIVGDYAWEQGWVQKGVRTDIDSFQEKSVKGKISVLRHIEHMVVRRARAVITPSVYLKNMVRKWGARAGRTYVVYNSFAPPDSRLKMSQSDAFRFLGISGRVALSVCRLVPWKGVDMLIEIWPEVVERVPDAILIVIGEGPEFDRLIGKVAEYKMEKRIWILGKMPKREVYMYYQAADLFVLNSAYEGFSHVLLEASYFHLPIIASAIGGNREVVDSPKVGTLLPYNDKEEWKNAIINLFLNSPKKEKRGENLISHEFSPEHMMDSLEKIFITIRN